MQDPDSSIDERLAAVSDEWRSLRYTGPALDMQPVTDRSPLRLLWLAPIAAALAIVTLWPKVDPPPEWPGTLRPIVRDSPFAASAPVSPSASVAFRLPRAPVRHSCISQTDNCDQPAG